MDGAGERPRPRDGDRGERRGEIRSENLERRFREHERRDVATSVVGVVVVQVLAGRQLRVEYFPGVRADAVAGFDANAKIYER